MQEEGDAKVDIFLFIVLRIRFNVNCCTVPYYVDKKPAYFLIGKHCPKKQGSAPMTVGACLL